jgi:hypothetical protein
MNEHIKEMRKQLVEKLGQAKAILIVITDEFQKAYIQNKNLQTEIQTEIDKIDKAIIEDALK